MHDVIQDSGEQLALFTTGEARSMLDQLLTDSRLYTRSTDYQALLDFVVRLRNFAPFNAMLLQVQKPGLSYAASARDWRERFDRTPKDGARPLLILWPFGPVALVYDVQDTEGKELPANVDPFFATGSISPEQFESFKMKLFYKHIEWQSVDAGGHHAGSIRVTKRATKGKDPTHYRLQVNMNHDPAAQCATMFHELGHLFLGHLGVDHALNIPSRSIDHTRLELEAESVCYLLCARHGVQTRSDAYLHKYLTENIYIENIDLYHIMRAGGQIEALLGISAHTRFDAPPRKRKRQG